MKGRYIGENVRLIISVIHVDFLETNKKPGLLFFADFQKAFDSLSHTFIIDCLKSFNFGPDLIKWIEIFYNDIFSNIINNGFMSDQFQIQKGVRQGCPLSSSLFIICLQVLTNYIKLNKDIEGIKVGDEEIKQSLYADDATFFNNGTEKSFENLIQSIHLFSKCSGLFLNIKKSIILRVGTLKNSNIKYSSENKFTWTSESATALGITFYNNHRETIKYNTNKKINEFHMTLKQWSHRKLTLMGKVTVVKSYALPKLIYPLTVLENPSTQIIDNLQKEIFKFIWNNKPDKVKRSILFQGYEYGGLKLTNLNLFISAIKASWVKRYLDNENSGQWKIFLKNRLEKYGNSLIFDCEIDEKLIKRISLNNNFLNNILTSWIKIKDNLNKDNIIVAKLIIWNNKNVTENKSTIFYKDWFDRGIQFFEHIFDFRNSTFYNFETFSHLYDIPKNDLL